MNKTILTTHSNGFYPIHKNGATNKPNAKLTQFKDHPKRPSAGSNTENKLKKKKYF